MRQIDLAIPSYSKYCGGLNVPYLLAGRHLSVAFSEKIALTERILHVALAIILCIPVAGHLLAAVHYSLSLKKNNNKSSYSKFISPKFPSPIPIEPIKPLEIANNFVIKDKKESLVEYLTRLRREMYARMKTNPCLKINRKEIHRSKGSRDAYIINPFQEAIKNNNIEVVKFFLSDNRFKINKSKCTFEWNNPLFESNIAMSEHPLHFAILKNNKDVFDLLINHKKIDVNYNESIPALYLACLLGEKGEPFILELLKKKVNPFVETPLAYYFNRYYGISKIEFENEKEITLLNIARKSGINDECIKSLQQYMELNARNDHGYTKLHQAILENNFEKFEKALKEGVSPNVPDSRGVFPLHLALCCQDKELALKMCSRLLEEGAYIDSRGYEGKTPLELLFFNQDGSSVKLAEMFLEKGADLTNISINTAFIWKDPLLKKVNKWYLEPYKETLEEWANIDNMSSLFAVQISSERQGKDVTKFGENLPSLIFEFLADAFNNFLIKQPDLSFSSLKKTVDLSRDLVQVSRLDAWGLFQKAFDNKEHPIIIPSGFRGHATAVVLFKDKLIFCNRGDPYIYKDEPLESGLHVFTFNPQKLDEALFNQLLDSKGFKGSQHIDEIISKLEGEKVTYIPCKYQKNKNCSWSSSASLGLRAALLLQKNDKEEIDFLTLNENIKPQMKEFHHFAKYWAVNKYIEHLNLNLEKIISFSNIKLEKLVMKLCEKIKKQKDRHGFYRKALDKITFSGIPLNLTYKKEALFYASLYRKAEDTEEFNTQFVESLKFNEYAIDNCLFTSHFASFLKFNEYQIGK